VQLRDSLYRLEDGVATFTMNRPERRNALSLELRQDFVDLMAEVRGNDAVRALVIIGAGGAFCAGGDVKSMGAGLGSAADGRARILEIHAWLQELYNLDCPTIAAVDGPAFGGGFSLALACDFVLATPRARFCAVFGRIGLIPDMAMLYLLPRAIGLQRAKELMMTTRVHDAAEAQALGLVLEQHAPEALVDAAQALGARLAEGSKTAQALTRAYAHLSLHSDYRTMMELEVVGQTVCFDTDYHREAVRRFKDKEPLRYDWEALGRAAGA